MKKKGKVTLGWVLSLVALAVIVATTLASVSITTSTLAAILWSVGIALVSLALVVVLILVKIIDRSIYFKRNAIIELVLCSVIVIAYAVVFFVAKPNNQFFVFCLKSDEIRQAVKDNAAEIKKIDASYEEYTLKIMNEYEETLNGLDESSSEYVAEKLNIVTIGDVLTKYKAFNTNYQKEIYDAFADEAIANVDKLGSIKLMPQCKIVYDFAESVVDSLTNINQNRNSPSYTPAEWKYKLDSEKFMKYKNPQPLCWLTIIVDLVLLVLVFFPYLFALRDGRHPGLFRVLFNNKNKGGSRGGDGFEIDETQGSDDNGTVEENNDELEFKI